MTSPLPLPGRPLDSFNLLLCRFRNRPHSSQYSGEPTRPPRGQPALPAGGRSEEEEGDQASPLSPSWTSGRLPGSPVAAAPCAHLPSGSGPGVSGEGPAAPPVQCSEARRLRLRGWGCCWAASSGSMAPRGVGQWPGAWEARRDGHRAGLLLPRENFLSGARRRRHLPVFENGGRAAASQSGDNGQLLGNMSPTPLPIPPRA